MGNVNITVNSKKLSVPDGSTILAAAALGDIKIPTLCTLKGIDPRANCRICVVEVEGARAFQPACATKVFEGMVVKTDTPAIRKSRKTTLELLLSRHAVDCHHCMRIGSSKCDDLNPTFCEMCFFCDCVRDGFCELQALAREYKVDALPFEAEACKYDLDESTGSIIRNPNKCIKCRRCVDVCNGVQTAHNLSAVNRGSDVMIMPEMGKSLADSPCVQCGRCVGVCPTGAVFAAEHKDDILYHTHKYGVTTFAQISQDVLPQLAELFKLDTPVADIKLVAAGLRKIGVDYVVSDDYAIATAASAAENALAKRLASGKGTVIVTNSPAAVKFVKKNFAALSGNMFVNNSAQQEFGNCVKTEIAKQRRLDLSNIRTISITSSSENAAEAHETGSVDYSVSARELYRIFLRTGVDLKKRRPSELDSFGSADMSKLTYKALFEPVEWAMDGSVEELEIAFDGRRIKAAIAKNLGQARRLLTEVKNGTSPYDVIRITA